MLKLTVQKNTQIMSRKHAYTPYFKVCRKNQNHYSKWPQVSQVQDDLVVDINTSEEDFLIQELIVIM